MGLISNGTTIFDAGSISAGLGGSMTFIKKITISSGVANVDFVNGSSSVVLDNTYKEYMFTLNNIHASSQGDILKINFSDDTSSHSYDLTKSTTRVNVRHDEDGTDGEVTYVSGSDLANSTDSQEIIVNLNANNDSGASGFMRLFDPSNTTFVKHFLVQMNSDGESDRCFSTYVSGYCNTTAAVTAVRFTLGGSNIDAGDICLYGIS